MSYQGNKPPTSFESPKKDRFTGISGTTCSLTYAVSSVADILVWVNGVKQDFTNYSVSGSTLTLGGTLVSADIVEVTYVGRTYGSTAPTDASVGANQVQASIITGQTALGATPADTDELLISDAGTLKRVDYSYLKSTVVNRPNAAPLIINGDMAVAQRSANATGLGGGSGYKSLDRFYSTFYYTSSNVGTFTQSQSTDVPTGYGFRNSFKTDCTTAQTSLPATSQIAIRYVVEAQDLNPFKFGTANAEKMTLAFWVKSNLTGTYNVSLYNADGGSTPQVNSQYSISSANTWEKKVLVFPADTSNGFNDDNGAGLYIDWIMGSGSTYTGGTAPTTWSSFVNNTYNGGSTINMASSTSNEWLITGIQLEVGEYTSSSIPSFQHETYGENLARCQRYFNMICEGSQKPIGNGLFWEAQEVFVTMPINGSTMRTTPSIYQTTGTDYFWAYRNGAADGLTELTLNGSSSERVITFYVGSSQGLASDTKNRPVFFRSGQTASRLGLNAEL